jgi:putative DNA primase/helicase
MATVYEQARRKAQGADILDVARRHAVLSKLKKIGDEFVGACPHCGGRDRFAINPRKVGKNGKKGLFGCRGCPNGGDAIDLEQFLSGTKFKDAVRDLSGAASVEEDPGEGARRRRKWAFCREVIEETVDSLTPVQGSLGETYLRDERAIDTNLPAIRRVLETVVEIGWHPSVYFAQTDPSEAFHELHGRRLGCIVGMMTDPATGERLGPISRTYLFRGKKVGKAKTLKQAEAEKLGVVRISLGADAGQLAVAEGIETGLAVLEMGGVPVWSTGSDSIMRFLPVVDDVDELLIGADNDARGPGERGASERAARMLKSRWLKAGRRAQIFMPRGFKTDFNDVLMQRKGRSR